LSSDVDEDGEVPDVAEFEGEAEDEERGPKVNIPSNSFIHNIA
jgi:hypothetical protein